MGSFIRFVAFASGLSAIVACAGGGQTSLAPSHSSETGVMRDSYGRAMSWDPVDGRWLSLDHGQSVDPSKSPSSVATRHMPAHVDIAEANGGCDPEETAARTRFDCSGDGGAIQTAPPATVSSLTLGSDGMYTDQLGNQWSYCSSCTTPAGSSGAATQGQWLEEIADTSSSGGFISVYENIGYEALDTIAYVSTTAKAPTAYKSYPSREYIYFNVNHFWSQHLACYLTGTQDQFLDAVAANLNSYIASGAMGIFGQFSFSYEGYTITYNAFHFPIIGDYLVGTAYIPQKPNC